MNIPLIYGIGWNRDSPFVRLLGCDRRIYDCGDVGFDVLVDFNNDVIAERINYKTIVRSAIIAN